MAKIILEKLLTYETIIWDWNGTLLNDADIGHEVESILFRRHGVTPLSKEERARLFRFPISDYYQERGFDFSKKSYDELSREWLEIYESQVKLAPLFEGVPEMLGELRQKGSDQFILSAAPQDHLMDMMLHHNLADYFKAIYGLENARADSKVGRGLELAKEGPRHIPVLIGHTHWDHIQGFPFFAPAYIPGFSLTLYGASGFRKDLKSVFQGQLDRDYFPVELKDMHAKLDFKTFESNPIKFGKISVAWDFTNHPGATVCFRIDVGGKRIGYITDNEFLQGYLGRPHDLTPESEVCKPYLRTIEFVKGCDLLIAEAQYTCDEYPKKIGWGHTGLANACLLAKFSGAKSWIVTHHDPMNDDDTLLRKLALTRQILKSMDCDIYATHAYDGMVEYV